MTILRLLFAPNSFFGVWISNSRKKRYVYMRLGLGILSLETFSQDPKMHGKNVHRTPRKRAAAHLWKWWSFLKMVSLAKRCLTLELEGTGRSSFISFETSVHSRKRLCHRLDSWNLPLSERSHKGKKRFYTNSCLIQQTRSKNYFYAVLRSRHSVRMSDYILWFHEARGSGRSGA